MEYVEMILKSPQDKQKLLDDIFALLEEIRRRYTLQLPKPEEGGRFCIVQDLILKTNMLGSKVYQLTRVQSSRKERRKKLGKFSFDHISKIRECLDQINPLLYSMDVSTMAIRKIVPPVRKYLKFQDPNHPLRRTIHISKVARPAHEVQNTVQRGRSNYRATSQATMQVFASESVSQSIVEECGSEKENYHSLLSKIITHITQFPLVKIQSRSSLYEDLLLLGYTVEKYMNKLPLVSTPINVGCLRLAYLRGMTQEHLSQIHETIQSNKDINPSYMLINSYDERKVNVEILKDEKETSPVQEIIVQSIIPAAFSPEHLSFKKEASSEEDMDSAHRAELLEIWRFANRDVGVAAEDRKDNNIVHKMERHIFRKSAF